jgi:release factor glutamine methyltransferase
VANPPYLSEEETAAAEPEVRGHEPRTALVSTEQGIADLRKIVATAPQFMNPGSLLALETGVAHHVELIKLCAESGFSRIESRQDLTERDRFIFAWR